MRQPEREEPEVAFPSGAVESLGRWDWRSLRNGGIGISVWPLHWSWPAIYRSDDRWGGSIILRIGPLDLEFHFNDGSV